MNLRLGKTLEQWLGSRTEGDDQVLRWISARREGPETYMVTLFEGREDEGAAHTVYETYALEADEDGAAQFADEAAREFFFSDEEALLAFVETDLGGSRERFVNEGFIDDEYRNARGAR